MFSPYVDADSPVIYDVEEVRAQQRAAREKEELELLELSEAGITGAVIMEDQDPGVLVKKKRNPRFSSLNLERKFLILLFCFMAPSFEAWEAHQCLKNRLGIVRARGGG